MHALVLASLLAAPAQPPAAHDDQNPLFKRLTGEGLDVGDKAVIKFPAPSMPDGLAAAKQTEIIKKLIDGKYAYDEFTRNSVVAPQVVTISNPAGGLKNAPPRSASVWFVVHGDFKKLEDDKFLDKLVGGTKGGGGKSGPLNGADLVKRDIKVADEKREGYGFVEFDFLEKVRLKVTGHAMWSRKADSVITAAEVDPRFRGDKDFPNEWRALNKGAAVPVGAPNPWGGAGMYLKITKLHEPPGALFVEQHIIFTEPTGWFDGKPILTSKLPLVVQDNVRTLRKEFVKK